jgi:Phospholipase_D-nuclease N-terminal
VVLALGIVELFLILILVVPWMWVLYDALRWDGAAWAEAGKSKVLWALLILVLPPLGVLTYLIAIRPELVAAKVATGGAPVEAPPDRGAEENPLLLMRRNTVVAIGLLLAAIAIAGILGVLRLWRLA